MNKIKILIGLVAFTFITPIVFAQNMKQMVVNSSSGVLEAVQKGDKTVVFNGRIYKYKIDEEASVLAIDETEPSALEINNLKVGERYYFDSVSYAKEPTISDFKEIVFITDIKPLVQE